MFIDPSFWSLCVTLMPPVVITITGFIMFYSWWRHQMETFSALLAICAGNSPFPGEFPAQRPVTRSFDVFFDLYPNKRLSKQWWGLWFETSSCPLWRHRNVPCRLRGPRKPRPTTGTRTNSTAPMVAPILILYMLREYKMYMQLFWILNTEIAGTLSRGRQGPLIKMLARGCWRLGDTCN